MLFHPIRQLADKFNTLQMGMVGADRIFKVLDTDEVATDDGKLAPSVLQGDIKFKDLNNDGVTIIQVTHSEKNAGYGSRIINLLDGRIVKN